VPRDFIIIILGIHTCRLERGITTGRKALPGMSVTPLRTAYRPILALRTAYRPILALRTAYRHFSASRTAYRLTTKTTNFWRFHLHKEDKMSLLHVQSFLQTLALMCLLVIIPSF